MLVGVIASCDLFLQDGGVIAHIYVFDTIALDGVQDPGLLSRPVRYSVLPVCTTGRV